MMLERDLEKIKRLAEKRKGENLRFRSFLKGCDGEAIDKTVHGLLDEIAPQIECSICRNCCIALRPMLNQDDIERLSDLLGLSEEAFRERYMAPHPSGASLLQGPPCPFLDEMHCTVESALPEECREYPHLHKNKFISRLLAVIDNYAVCPIVFNVYERLKEEVGFKETPMN